MDYKNSGVDIEAGYKSVELMKEHVKKTLRPEVLGGLGGFSGAFSLAKIKDMEEPTLVSGTDGCGTKVKLAFILDKHDTIGIDAVAMCVNDIACAGGEPLFFLDYIACGKNYPEKIATIVKGVAEGCLQSECALIGGETAEHPGLMPEDEYDLAGFAVGVVDKKDIIPVGAEITVTVTGIKNYAGDGSAPSTQSATFRFVAANIAKATVKVAAQIYTGKAIEPTKDDITVKFGKVTLEKTDYEIVDYSNNVKKGTAKVTIRGIGNYGGEKTVTFKINSKSMNYTIVYDKNFYIFSAW